MNATAKRFRVAFSFAGEKRDFVAQVAALLAARFTEAAILYDRYHEAEFARRDLGFYLPDLYHDQSDLVVVVVCRDYQQKEWCGLEWDAIFYLLKKRKNSEVMLCRFDHAMVQGLFSTAGFVELDDKTPEEATTRVLERLALNEGKPRDFYHSDVKHLVEESLKDAAPQSEPPVGQVPELASPDTPHEPLVDFEEFRRYVPAKLIGREDQTDALSLAWAQAQEDEAGRPLVVTITGMGGAGKSSLVAKWAASLGDQGWPGCDAVLAWSFYSQGTRELASVSADHFLKYALAFFRDPKMAGSSAKAAVKGGRLAEVIGQQRALLILDGLEPLQYPPTVPMAGQLRETGLSALLRGLAKKNRGLCIVTTRIAVHDLNTFLGGTVREDPLDGLSADAGATLLQKLGVEGDIELMKNLVTDVRGHALTLTLFGSFLKRAYGGNIAKRRQVKLEKADVTVQGGHAFRAMQAYQQWLLQGGDEGRREVAILRLMGLFDRPADAVSIQKLRSAIVRDFNEPLVGLSDEDLSLSLSTMEEAHLLTVVRQESGELKSIDAHPLLREYFAGKISPETRKRAEALLAKGDGGDAEHGDDSAGVEEPHDRLQNALSLSGGGFRATFFHLGILAFHFRRDSLKDLNIITAVSGGAILAAHAVLHWETLIHDEEGFRKVMAKLVTFARSNIRNKILVPWLWSVGTGWRFVGKAAMRLAKSRTGRLVRKYRAFYESRALSDLHKSSRPWLVLVATDLYDSSRVYFSHDGMRRLSIAGNAKEEPFPQKVDMEVAFAVAASSSFPPIFRPLVLDHKVLKIRWDEFKLEMRLQDGGVHDNLGLRALQLIASAGDVALGMIGASYAVNPDHINKPKIGLLSDRRRALQIFTRGESAEIANDIAALAGAKAVITKLSDRIAADQPHLLETDAQTALMSFRTDLDSPSWQEMYALMAHGYQVAAMHSRCLDKGDFTAARSLFCAILAESLAKENGSTPQEEMPSIEKMVSDLSAKQLHRCGVRPKGRIAIHLVLYLLLLFTVAFSAHRYGKPIATWIFQFYQPKDEVTTLTPTERNDFTRRIAEYESFGLVVLDDVEALKKTFEAAVLHGMTVGTDRRTVENNAQLGLGEAGMFSGSKERTWAPAEAVLSHLPKGGPVSPYDTWVEKTIETKLPLDPASYKAVLPADLHAKLPYTLQLLAVLSSEPPEATIELSATDLEARVTPYGSGWAVRDFWALPQAELTVSLKGTSTILLRAKAVFNDRFFFSRQILNAKGEDTTPLQQAGLSNNPVDWKWAWDDFNASGNWGISGKRLTAVQFIGSNWTGGKAYLNLFATAATWVDATEGGLGDAQAVQARAEVLRTSVIALFVRSCQSLEAASEPDVPWLVGRLTGSTFSLSREKLQSDCFRLENSRKILLNTLPPAFPRSLLNSAAAAVLLEDRTAPSDPVVKDQVLRTSIEQKVPREAFHQSIDGLRKELEHIQASTH